MSTEKSNTEKHFLCDDHDIWADEIRFFEVGREKVMVWRDDDETLYAYSATCPHQDRDLEETGKRECVCGPHDDDKTLTCTAHSWEFDLESGDGLNPSGPQLNEYEIGVENGEIFVVINGGASND
ncbi:Rieske 2Fe-2S domain-containing protein [Natronolimnohabitans sp. A-GB9]|uniref:Rieske 2Fe-2S domain-containing protein n=1 Tax=Natronolimnohabitans sp. A-GB9 TaxID=3069757 RepID=UPI0027B421F9|nr:Rieske 2Fe-2S domain-containing protein [Natronolimnohabitans sp. A-GB9]MDQ2052517.1 Rieske 2Fe-2S domain-containing protein [Natronolimnohabitans sp. A-GB9]